ncbi:MAG: T9SS type A sorting domain-containing protein, partial [Ignavibacteria bacterium]
GALRGIDLVYQGNIPKVAFDLIKMDDQGNFFPGICSKIMFWSPNINGGVAFPIADSSNTPCNRIASNTGGDVFTPICRATIGRLADYNCLYVVYNVARAEILDSINYYDMYVVRSGNDGGVSWVGRNRLTNLSGPLRDCRYPSISPSNDIISGHPYANLLYQSDSIPGSHVTGSQASLAKIRFMRLRFLSCLFIGGIKKINNELPQVFKLYQNYPNPFNPKTIINFQLPMFNYVKLIIYDALGREVKTLVNEELRPGTYEVDWDAGKYPSGVYFYRIEAGDYKETKKMVLVK